MTDETYNGYANRETWAFNLHWQNDQGLYNYVLEEARSYLDGEGDNASDPVGDWQLGYAVVQRIREELPDLAPDAWELLREDVGSWWRVDEAEVGAAVRESLDAESE